MSAPDVAAVLGAHVAAAGPISGGWMCTCGAQSTNGSIHTNDLTSREDRATEYRAHVAEALQPVIAAAQAEALRGAADAWTHGEWANHMVTASDPAQIRIGSANRFGEWLRDRAGRIGGDA